MVREHFSRESVYWMPIPELYDYINIINEEHEKEEAEWKTTEETEEKSSTFFDVFGDIGNPLK